MRVIIQQASPKDWPEIRRIYIEGIRTKHATFQSERDVYDAPSFFSGKIHGMTYKAVNSHNSMIGWASLSSVSDRCVYNGVAEVSVYVETALHGHGIGSKLLSHLVEASEKQQIWTLQAGIFPENVASINLHKKLGFREVGLREKLGKMDDVWRDVVLLERRSDKIY